MKADGITLLIGKDGVATVYDDTYDITIHCESAEEMEQVKENLNRYRWIPADKPPQIGQNIILSFENLSITLPGYYDGDEQGGAYYDDYGKPFVERYLFANAWMPMPNPYRPEEK
jgi:hypothetical protein